MTLQITILTLFPEIFPGPLAASLVGKALEKKIWDLQVVNIRDFAKDKHQTVDDTPFGGGPGMVMRPDVIHDALASFATPGQKRVIYLSPRGKVFTQKVASSIAYETKSIVILCGRYEGVDQRVLDFWQAEEISLGDFILTGGELAAMAMLDASIRLLPGVIGEAESIIDESFSRGLLEYPHYTRPRVWKDLEVPAVLLSGHHQEISAWRLKEAQAVTKVRRPDLWQAYTRSE